MRAILLVAASVAVFSGCFPDPDNLPTDTSASPDDVTGVDTVSPPDSSSDIEVRLNVCGGEGLTAPGTPGQPCGDCEDGVWACDPADPEKNRTVCQGASARNACGGCGVVEPPLESPCGECGVVACDAETRLGRCVEPTEGCETFVTCEQLDCEALLRVCAAPAGEDAACGTCVQAAVDVDGTCVLPPRAPSGVEATVDDAELVSVTWRAVEGASSYRVEFCDEDTCDSEDWETLPNGEVAGLRYDDATAPAPPAPGQVHGLEATTTASVLVSLSWSPTDIGNGALRRYRVIALSAALQSAPSSIVSGQRAARSITGYQVSIDGGAWVDLDIDPAAQVWTDTSAPAPTLTAGVATASEGLYAAYVALSLSGDDATVGATRRYRVRALSDAGAGPASVEVVGYRAAPTTWSVAWERSSGPSPEDFTLISGATTRTYEDTAAPADGSVRYYRARLSAQGLAYVYTQPVSGSRLPPPGVPGNVSATTHLEDRVRVTWQTVDGAIGYHVWRDGTKLTTGNGVTATLYDDTSIAGPSSGWSEPTGVSASTTDATQVTVSWSAPARPIGPSGSYQVQAVNPSGTSALSGAATGWRSAPPLSGYEVEIGGQWQETSSLETSFAHTSAPAGVITVGSVAATRGDHRAHVRLEVSGHSVAPTAVAYRVRGVISSGARTQASASATGSRAVGALAVQWERSATASSGSSFSAITGASTAAFEDTVAPNNGEKRWYRVRLSASGADTVTSESVEGWRIAIVKVAVGGEHACALAADGAVWCWGSGAEGQLGHGATVTSVSAPVRVVTTSVFSDVFVGNSHSCAFSPGDGLYCWGRNAAGQLGDGTNGNASIPVRASLPDSPLSGSTGIAHVCARVSGGAVWCWGANLDGQLGQGSPGEASWVPVQVRTSSTSALSNVTFVAVGGASSCAIRTGASLYCWGDNRQGQLGVGSEDDYEAYASQVTGITGVVGVDLGAGHACALTGLGKTFCWGQNSFGQLGADVGAGSASPVEVNGSFDTIISAGDSLTCARGSSGGAYCWGSGFYGELGNGTNETSTTPQRVNDLVDIASLGVGRNHVCAVASGELYCWGQNGFRRKLADGTTQDRSSPVRVQLP